VKEKEKLKILIMQFINLKCIAECQNTILQALLLKGKGRHLDKERKTNTNILIFIGVK
jgi:hypothetical protein